MPRCRVEPHLPELGDRLLRRAALEAPHVRARVARGRALVRERARVRADAEGVQRRLRLRERRAAALELLELLDEQRRRRADVVDDELVAERGVAELVAGRARRAGGPRGRGPAAGLGRRASAPAGRARRPRRARVAAARSPPPAPAAAAAAPARLAGAAGSAAQWWSYTCTERACASHSAPRPMRATRRASTTPSAWRSAASIVLKPRSGSRCLWNARKRPTTGCALRGSTTCVGRSGRVTDHSFASATAAASESKSAFECVSTTLHGSEYFSAAGASGGAAPPAFRRFALDAARATRDGGRRARARARRRARARSSPPRPARGI